MRLAHLHSFQLCARGGRQIQRVITVFEGEIDSEERLNDGVLLTSTPSLSKLKKQKKRQGKLPPYPSLLAPNRHQKKIKNKK